MAAIPNATWYVYMVRCRDRSLYTGITTDVSRRLAEHRSPGSKGAKYLRGRAPLRLVFQGPARSRAAALRLERRIKRLPKARKEELLKRPALLAKLVAETAARGYGPCRSRFLSVA